MVSTAKPLMIGFRPSEQELAEAKEKLERLLVKNILPFWYPTIIDFDEGGYRLNHDCSGKWRGRAHKDTIAQARTVWFFSRLTRTPYGRPEHLRAARHGYEFLRDRLWDKQFGGFYWEVDSTGRQAVKPDKHLCPQSFALYALAEFARASGDPSAPALARELFEVIDTHAHDREYGGYREFFRRDWSATSSDLTGYVNTPPSVKLMSTHMHWMEAVAQYYVMTGEPAVRERLIELILVQSSSLHHKIRGANTDQYDRDWTPLSSPGDARSCGHDLKTIWSMADACTIAGISNGPWLSLYEKLFESAVREGFDHREGGFYERASRNILGGGRVKIWWVQAEGLICALRLYALTGRQSYWHAFTGTLSWIFKRQADWEHGEWYWEVGRGGRPSGDKAGPWKGPYHNGRAVIDCLERLSDAQPTLPACNQ